MESHYSILDNITTRHYDKITDITKHVLHEFFSRRKFVQLEHPKQPPLSREISQKVGEGVSRVDFPPIRCGSDHRELQWIYQSLLDGKQRFFAIKDPRGVSSQVEVDSLEVDFEIAASSFYEIRRLTESLLRQIVSTIMQGLEIPDKKIIESKISKWKRDFAVFTSSYLESKYGIHWEFEMKRLMHMPFWVLGSRTLLGDKTVMGIDGREYTLSFELHMPESHATIASGSIRETEYAYLLDQLRKTGKSLYAHSELLENVTDEKYTHSVGMCVDLYEFLSSIFGHLNLDISKHLIRPDIASDGLEC